MSLWNPSYRAEHRSICSICYWQHGAWGVGWHGAGHGFSLCQQQKVVFRVAALMIKGRVGTLHAEMAHFRESFQWSSQKGKNVTFGEVLSQSPLYNFVCILHCCLQNSVPGTTPSVGALCFLIVISTPQKGKQLLSGMRQCQSLSYSTDPRDCVCTETHSENI